MQKDIDGMRRAVFCFHHLGVIKMTKPATESNNGRSLPTAKLPGPAMRTGADEQAPSPGFLRGLEEMLQ